MNKHIIITPFDMHGSQVHENICNLTKKVTWKIHTSLNCEIVFSILPSRGYLYNSKYGCVILNIFIIIIMLLATIVYESFKDYIAVEMLEGENKYDAEKYGLQVSQQFSYWCPLNCLCALSILCRKQRRV